MTVSDAATQPQLLLLFRIPTSDSLSQKRNGIYSWISQKRTRFYRLFVVPNVRGLQLRAVWWSYWDEGTIYPGICSIHSIFNDHVVDLYQAAPKTPLWSADVADLPAQSQLISYRKCFLLVKFLIKTVFLRSTEGTLKAPNLWHQCFWFRQWFSMNIKPGWTSVHCWLSQTQII